MRTPRRRFLQSLLGAAGLAALGAPARALTPAHGAPDAWQAGFDAALADQPWLAAYAGVQVDAPTLPMTLQGRWPQDLRGSLYRNGAARFGLAGQRYHHWFDGDGMIQQWVGSMGMLPMLAFSREQEEAAEADALQALLRVYGHAGGAATFFEHVAEQSALPEPPALLNTHPDTDARIARIRDFEQAHIRPDELALKPLPDFVKSDKTDGTDPD